jgi:hypothetical protein
MLDERLTYAKGGDGETKVHGVRYVTISNPAFSERTTPNVLESSFRNPRDTYLILLTSRLTGQEAPYNDGLGHREVSHQDALNAVSHPN